MDLADLIKNITLRVEVNFPQIDTLSGRLEGRIDAGVDRLEGLLMLTRDELVQQVNSKFTDTQAVIANEMSEIGAMLLGLRDQMGQLQRDLDAANANLDLTSAAGTIMAGFDDLQSRINGMSDALAPAPPPAPEPPPVEPPVEPEPVPVEPVAPEQARR